MSQSTLCLGSVVPFAIFIIIIGVPRLINNQEALIIIAIIIISIIVAFPMSLSIRRMYLSWAHENGIPTCYPGCTQPCLSNLTLWILSNCLLELAAPCISQCTQNLWKWHIWETWSQGNSSRNKFSWEWSISLTSPFPKQKGTQIVGTKHNKSTIWKASGWVKGIFVFSQKSHSHWRKICCKLRLLEQIDFLHFI